MLTDRPDPRDEFNSRDAKEVNNLNVEDNNEQIELSWEEISKEYEYKYDIEKWNDYDAWEEIISHNVAI